MNEYLIYRIEQIEDSGASNKSYKRPTIQKSVLPVYNCRSRLKLKYKDVWRLSTLWISATSVRYTLMKKVMIFSWTFNNIKFMNSENVV